MSLRINKQRDPASSKAARSRAAQSLYIETFGSDSPEDVMPCTFCHRNKLSCKMADDSSRCLECVRRGRTCDGLFVGASLFKHMETQKRLQSEEEVAEEEFLQIQAQIAELQSRSNTAVSRLARLRKQRRFLESRRKDLADQNSKSLEELDGVRREESSTVLDLHSLGHVDIIDWASIGLPSSDVPLVDPLASAVPGSSDGIVQQPERRSPGVS